VTQKQQERNMTMKNWKKWLISGLVLLVGSGAYAGLKGETQVYYAHDAAPAVRIHNTSDETVVITITGDSASDDTVVIGSTSTTLDLSGTAIDTIAELQAAIEACADSDEKTPLETESYCAAATSETIDDELLAEAVTIRPGDWGALHWDTSDTKHYRTSIPKSEHGSKRGSMVVKSVYGSAGGTGDITVIGYLNRTEVYRKVIESPVYAWSAAGTTETWASDDVSMGNIEIPLDIVVAPSDCFLVSVQRETTGTTGGIGLRVKALE